jgi:hypothetical protein
MAAGCALVIAGQWVQQSRVRRTHTVCPCVYPSIYLSVHLPACLHSFLSACLHVCPSACLHVSARSVCMCVSSVRQFDCLLVARITTIPRCTTSKLMGGRQADGRGLGWQACGYGWNACTVWRSRSVRPYIMAGLEKQCSTCTRSCRRKLWGPAPPRPSRLQRSSVCDGQHARACRACHHLK